MIVSTTILASCVAPPAARAWQTSVFGSRYFAEDVARSVAVTSGGDVVVAGWLDCGTTIRALGRSAGAVLWRRDAGGGLCSVGNDDGPGSPKLALDAKGAVYYAHGSGVGKLDERGNPVWFTDVIIGELTVIESLAIDANGDVLAAGYVDTTDDVGGALDFLVTKLAGGTGSIIWQETFDGTPDPTPPSPDAGFDDSDQSSDVATSVAADADGDAVVAGLIEHEGEPRMAVLKLAAATGDVLWRNEDTPGSAETVAVRGDGDVVVAGRTLAKDIVVRRLAAVDGGERWHHAIVGDAPSETRGTIGLALVGGDALVTGAIVNGATGSDVAVVRLSGEGDERWRTVVNGDGDAPDFPAALALDSSGRVVIAATLSTPGDDGDFAALALDGTTGAVSWRALVAGTAGQADHGNAVAIGTDDTVAVAGVTRNTETGPDFTTLLLDATDGGEHWRRDFAGVVDGFDEGRAVLALPDGDVIAAGHVFNGFDRSWDGVVVRLGAEGGAEQWRQEINSGWEARPLGDNDDIAALAMDAAGDLAVAGTLSHDFRSHAFGVVKLRGATGEETWRTAIDGTFFAGDDVATALAFDPDGNVDAVGGLSSNTYGSILEHFVVELDGATGAERWRHLITDRSGIALAVAVDHHGDVLVAGSLDKQPNGSDFAVLKLDGNTGDERWRRTIAGANFYRSAATKVAIDARGDVVVSGQLTSGTASTGNAVVVKLADDTGDVVWQRVLDDGDDHSFATRSVAVDASGDVVVLAIMAEQSGVDVSAFRLASVTGDVRWRQVVSRNLPDYVGAVTVDVHGDVVATTESTPAPDTDLLVVKLAGGTGAERWRRTLHGTAQASDPVVRDDMGVGVATDPRGDVAVVGQFVNAGSGFDMAVAKLRGRDGSDALDRDGQRCRRALRRASANVLLTQIAALQRCRDAVNAGALTIDPAACGDHDAVRDALTAAEASARKLVVASCDDAVLAGLRACGTSLDAVVAPDGGGCLVNGSAAAADAIVAAEYGRVLAPAERELRSCQNTIASAGRRLARSLVQDLYGCGRAADRGSVAECVPGVRPSTSRWAADAIADDCDDAQLASLGACGLDLAHLAPASGAGCLAVTALAAVAPH